MNSLFYFFIPVMSALIGWITNYLAIKMLFHPKKPIRIVFFQIQGIFPKRKHFFAERFGKIVADKLFNKDSLKKRLNNPDMHDSLKAEILYSVNIEIEEIFSGNMFFKFAGNRFNKKIQEKMEVMVDKLLPNLMSKIDHKIDNLDIEQIVSQKITTFSNQQFEMLMMSVIKKELKFIEFAGAILGFMVGCLQILIISMS